MCECGPHARPLPFSELGIASAILSMKHIELGERFDGTAEIKCPWVLALCAEARVWVLDESLGQPIPLCTTCAGGPLLGWQADGKALYTLDARRRLQQVNVHTGDQNVSRPVGVMPQDWDHSCEVPCRLWPAANATVLFCLTANLQRSTVSLWEVDTRGRIASLIRPRISLGVDYCAASHCMLCYHTQVPGVVTLEDLRKNSVEELRLTTHDIIHAAFSPSGRQIIFSQLSDDAHKLQCFDVDVCEAVGLARATYASFSPQGEKIAAVWADQELLMIDRASGVVEMVARTRQRQSETDLPFSIPVVPQWSPDGKWLAFCLWEWEEETPPVHIPHAAKKFSPNKLSTFVLDVQTRTVLRTPLASQCFAWCPIPTQK